MPEQKRGDLHAPLWGVFLIFLGVVFLLQALNILPWGLWRTLLRYWPVLVIIIGLSILLRHRSPWLIALIFVIMLAASVGIAIWQYGAPTPPASLTYTQPVGNLESAQVNLDFNAGNLMLAALPANSPSLVEADGSGLSGQLTNQGKEGLLSLSKQVAEPRPGEMKWDIKLTRNLPLKIDARLAASNVDLDLSELKTTELKLNIDAGNCKVRTPSSESITASIKNAVSNVEITIPAGVSARIKAKTSMSALDIDEGRFPRRGDYYISPNYDTAQNRIDLEIDSSLGRVELR